MDGLVERSKEDCVRGTRLMKSEKSTKSIALAYTNDAKRVLGGREEVDLKS